MPISNRSCLIASANPDALAIAPDVSYGMLDQLIARTVRFLQLQGHRPGACLLIVAHLQIETICLLFAAWRLQCTVLLIAPSTPPKELQSILDQARPCVLAPLNLPFEHSSERLYDLDIPALLLLTSGSSGPRKMASLTLRQLLDSAQTVASALHANPQDRWLLSLPLHHVSGLGVMLRAFYSEGTLVFDNKTLPIYERLSQSSCRFTSLVPTQLYRLLKTPFPPPSSHLLIGGAQLAHSLYTRALALGFSLSLTYGLTEMCSTVLLSHKPIWIDSLAYLGHPLPGREMRLVDGEIHVRGNCLFSGYGHPCRSSFDWFATKDLGRFDPCHGFAVDGRKDLQFICGGENIQPEEIETILLSHPRIAKACVVPKFDPEFGARPFAFVETDLPSDAIASYLADLLPKYKIPVGFSFLHEDEQTKPNRSKLIEHVNKKSSFI